MCGRYTFTKAPNASDVVQAPDQAQLPLEPRYNIAPSQMCLIKPMEDPAHYHFYRWGLIPFWAKDIKIGYKLINARSETVLEKNSFREAIRKRRCLVPADGFYEWKKTQTGKQPYYIGLQNGATMHFAGITESWTSPQGERIYSFSILTMPPNELMSGIHDRMPMILDRYFQEKWLHPQTEIAELLRSISPYPTELMQAIAVSPQVGNVRNDHPGLIEPFTPPQLLF